MARVRRRREPIVSLIWSISVIFWLIGVVFLIDPYGSAGKRAAGVGMTAVAVLCGYVAGRWREL